MSRCSAIVLRQAQDKRRETRVGASGSDTRRKQRHTARRSWERLGDERGASVAESTVRAYVGRVRRELESGAVAVTISQVHSPGAEAEVDFASVRVWLDGVLTQLSMFVMRLSHSGRAVHLCSPSEGREASLEGHVVAFECLGVAVRIRWCADEGETDQPCPSSPTTSG